jgi:hypothetical protein
LIVYTIQMGKWRVAQALKIPFKDITVKSGDPIFAPDWDMVLGHRDGKITDAEYTKKYYEKMLRMYNQYRPEWDELLAKPTVAISCYCSANKFCHRHILREIIEKILNKRELPYQYGGEIMSASMPLINADGGDELH